MAAGEGEGGHGARMTIPARSTRGKRMNALLGEAEDADKEFWDQEFFAEEKRDGEYEKSDSETSFYDSDFDDAEDHGDGDGDEDDSDDEERRERLRRKKKLLPPGRPKPRSAPRPRPVTKVEEKNAPAPAGYMSVDGQRRFSALRRDMAGAEIVRKSSRSSVVEASARHEEQRRMQEVEQRIRKIKRDSESYTRPKAMAISAEDLIRESCLYTEVYNAQSLNYLLEREEEAKRRHAIKTRKLYDEPKVKYRSFRGKDGLERTEVEYANGAEIPRPGGRLPERSQPSSPKPKKMRSLASLKLKIKLPTR